MHEILSTIFRGISKTFVKICIILDVIILFVICQENLLLRRQTKKHLAVLWAEPPYANFACILNFLMLSCFQMKQDVQEMSRICKQDVQDEAGFTR